MRRRRLVYAAAALLVVALGLVSRKHPTLFPAVLGKYPGDALWALMVFLLIGFASPKISSGRLAMLSLAFSFLDEFSQLYQASWINTIRATTIGHLILGSTFSWSDMLSYVVGVAIGFLFEKLVLRQRA